MERRREMNMSEDTGSMKVAECPKSMCRKPNTVYG